MITSFNELRSSIDPPTDRSFGKSYEGTTDKWRNQMLYAQTMAMIQIAQELNEIKNILSVDGQSFIRAKLMEDRNLDAMLSVMAVRSGGDLRGVKRWDLRAAIVEVLGWEGIHA